eukprot:s266_g40.t1
MKEALQMLVLNAGYPFEFVRRHCMEWAASWIPKGSHDRTVVNLLDEASQCELLQRRGASDPPLCVCGGQLKLLELRERVKLLVDSTLVGVEAFNEDVNQQIGHTWLENPR